MSFVLEDIESVWDTTKRAVIYELLAFVLVLIISYLWFGTAAQPFWYSIVVFVMLCIHYITFHRHIMPI
jgi:hypothetical protein